jgi:hypothetical protein
MRSAAHLRGAHPPKNALAAAARASSGYGVIPKNQQQKFPLGTLIAYGPDLVRATKLVAAIIPEPDAEPIALQRWFVSEGDIRRDDRVSDEVVEFFEKHNARQTVVADRIMGCPHEEGIDYPLGSVCPECPFWAETDRFTHGPKSPADDPGLSGHITAQEILEALSENRGCPPQAALASADVRRAELTEPLLAAVERAIAEPAAASPDAASLCSHALYLLAKWREPRAFGPVLRWLSLPGDGAFDLTGDVPTQAGDRILASVCGGDRPEIRALVENRDANEYCRAKALQALAVLVAWGEMPREALVAYLGELIVEKLDRGPSHVWGAVACLVAELGLEQFRDLLRAPCADEWVDPFVIDWEEIEQCSAGGAAFEEYRRRHPPITDVAGETAWWGCYHHAAPAPPRTPHIAAPKVGRNDQCPCGSGKKYKKCCGKNA